ncbi:DUF305 domain-containing protein [Ramlibacter sp. H39-3-26]|jgi:uncharacterized protein (DUF305 family)|uniref:DUF305 domain-containing protein n=1 Tax=Curvibacter soli TaxID=3031331 RepID=UPI0023DB98FF|nr:DUF305 domain-containing protein [Ramlibacter sp. H39-3-26]MDF1484146.1 DUF305 domain-containing protein [Ramlibacter sp. H39-3-26]
MTASFLRFPLAVLALGGALLQPVAFAQPAAPHGHDSARAPAASGMGSGMHSGMDMKTMMKDMNEKMSSMRMSGDQDVDFAMMMRMHHQGAIDMAQAELQAGKDPQMRKMATNVIKAQKKEIAELDKFLAKHGHSGEAMKK